MASKGGLITARVFIWLTVVVIIAITAFTCYLCSCNIRASTFNNVQQREGLVNLYGSIFWGYPLALLGVVSGAAIIGLLVVADKHVHGMIPGKGKPTENKDKAKNKVPDKKPPNKPAVNNKSPRK